MGIMILDFGLRILDFFGKKLFRRTGIHPGYQWSIVNSQLSIEGSPSYIERKQSQANTLREYRADPTVRKGIG